MTLSSRGFEALLGAAPRLGRWAALAPLVVLGGCSHHDLGDVIDAIDGGGHGRGGRDVCVVDGERHRPGDSFPSSDGCNTCTCGGDGQVACTLRFCAATCGGIEGLACADGEYCEFPPEAQCGAADQTGFCAFRPQACTREFRPVCGCDEVTYANACEAASAGVSVIHEGECGSDDALQLGEACGGFRPPGSPDCDTGLFCQHQAGALCGAADAPGECVLIPDACADIFDPVCGCDGETYGNACQAAANLTGLFEDGACE